MLLLYRIIIFVVFFFSPLILIFRLINKKETYQSFLDKVGKIKNKRTKKGKLIWLHGSSVGEILGVIPLIEKLENKKDIKQILITSNTLSSSKIISNFLKENLYQLEKIDELLFLNLNLKLF